ncbi:hypothetical protein RJT34_04322 [Clitoria ternatea]|uniref:Uncharacterized protein n=1 Tax=Clitoria ternatea TaxID=43366 RepID=A0AAN9KPH8_CLITE
MGFLSNHCQQYPYDMKNMVLIGDRKLYNSSGSWYRNLMDACISKPSLCTLISGLLLLNEDILLLIEISVQEKDSIHSLLKFVKTMEITETEKLVILASLDKL